jgi:hypothetical protein
MAYKIQTPGNYPEENIQHEECCWTPLVFSVDRTRDIYVASSFVKLATYPSLNRSRGDIRCVCLNSLCTVFNFSVVGCGSHNAEFRLNCQSCSSFNVQTIKKYSNIERCSALKCCYSVYFNNVPQYSKCSPLQQFVIRAPFTLGTCKVTTALLIPYLSSGTLIL